MPHEGFDAQANINAFNMAVQNAERGGVAAEAMRETKYKSTFRLLESARKAGRLPKRTPEQQAEDERQIEALLNDPNELESLREFARLASTNTRETKSELTGHLEFLSKEDFTRRLAAGYRLELADAVAGLSSPPSGESREEGKRLTPLEQAKIDLKANKLYIENLGTELSFGDWNEVIRSYKRALGVAVAAGESGQALQQELLVELTAATAAKNELQQNGGRDGEKRDPISQSRNDLVATRSMLQAMLSEDQVDGITSGGLNSQMNDLKRALSRIATSEDPNAEALRQELLAEMVEVGKLQRKVDELRMAQRQRQMYGMQDNQIIAERMATELSGRELMPSMDPMQMRATSEMYRAEREQAEPQVKRDPRGHFARLQAAIMNSEGNAYAEIIELRAWIDSPKYFNDWERAMFKLPQDFGRALEAQKGPDLEHLGSSCGELKNWPIFALRDYCLPLVVEKNMGPENQAERKLVKMDFFTVMDMLESKPDLRAKLFSHNKDIVGAAEDEWSELICRELLGFSEAEFKSSPGKIKLFTVLGNADGDALWDIPDSAKTQNDRLIPWNPFANIPVYPARDQAGEISPVYERDYQRAGGVKTWREVSASMKFLQVGSMLFMKTFGREGQYDPAVLGEWPYAVRPGLRPETYHGYMYNHHLAELRPYAGHYYADILSENATKIDPMLMLLGNEIVMGAGLERKSANDMCVMLGTDSGIFRQEFSNEWKIRRSVGDVTRDIQESDYMAEAKRRVVELRTRIIDFVVMDKSVRPWFNSYLDAMARGERARIPSELLLIGFPGRNETKQLKGLFKDGLDTALSKKMTNVISSKELVLDFSNFDVALQFLLCNRSQKGWMRTKDQMLEIVGGLKTSPMVTRVFEGWNARPFLQSMGNSINVTDGFGGMEEAVKSRTIRSLRLDLLPEYGLWSWLNYLANARKSADINWSQLTGLNVASAPLIETRANTSPDNVVKEMGELSKAYGEKNGLWIMMKGFERGELMVDAFYSLVLNTIAAGEGHERRRFKIKKVKQSAMDGSVFGDTAFSNAANDQWESIPVSSATVRPGLGFRVYSVVQDPKASTVQADGSVAFGTQAKQVVVGPGGAVVFEAQAVQNETTSPMQKMYGGRPVDLSLLSKIINSASDSGAVTEHTVYSVLANFLQSMGNRIPKEILTETEEAIRMNSAMFRR